jgi:magnesium chelatase family protein
MGLAVVGKMDVFPPDELGGYAALGELSLAGGIVSVAGILPAAISDADREWGLICPEAQGPEAALAEKLKTLAAPDLVSLINHFRGTQILLPPAVGGLADTPPGPDLDQVKGMETARRAREILATGAIIYP